MRRPLLGLVGLQLTLVAGLAALARDLPEPASVPQVAGLALAVAVVGLLPLRLELWRHSFTITLTEAVLVVGLFVAGPLQLAVAAAVGEGVACLVLRQRRVEVAVNMSQAVLTALLGSLAFTAAGATDPARPGAWLAVVAAVGTCTTFGLASVSWVVARAEGRPFDLILRTSLPTTVVTVAGAASVGLVVVLLATVDPLAPLLLAPLLVLVALESKGLAGQRAEHLRVQRLYEASSRTASLASLDDVLVTLAEEARGLLTGARAVCATVDEAGGWHAMAVDDTGSLRLDDDAAAVLQRPEASAAALLVAFGAETGEVVRTSAGGAGVPVVLAVHRQRALGGDGAADVLAAFAAHAALAVANAALYHEVQDALARQIDLNRQKDEFVAAVSHELRTPLTSVLASMQTIRRLGERLDEDRRSLLVDSAVDQGRRLKRLIEDLLLAASADHGAVQTVHEAVDVPALLAGVVEEMSAAAEGRVLLAVDPGLGELVSDAHRLRQILVNLVENATKYAPGAPVEVSARQVAGICYLSVRDWGPGIAPEDRERVFDRFVQLDQSSTRQCGGTGLGLYLCRRLAEALGATLTLSSPAGGGACFSLALTAADAAAAGGPEPVALRSA